MIASISLPPSLRPAYYSNTTGVDGIFTQEKVALDRIAVSVTQSQRSFALSEGVVAKDVEIRFAGDDFDFSINPFKQVVLYSDMSIDKAGLAIA